MNKMDMIRKLLSSGSQTAPALIDDVAEEINPIARRVTTEATEVAPEVIGKGIPTQKAAADIIDAELIAPKVSTLDAAKDFAKNNKGKLIGGLTLAEMARQMMGGEESPVMMTPPQAKEKITPVSEAIAPTPEAPATLKKEAPEKAPESALSETEPSASESSLNPDTMYLDRLAGAQTADADNQFLTTLIRAGNQAGSAIAQVKPDYSGVEALEKNAGRNVANFKEGMATRGEAQKLGKAQDEITDEKSLRDPNSKISQETKAQLAKYGINVKTAMEAKQLNPQIFNLLMADRAQQNQKEIARIGATNKSTKLEKDLDEKQRKFARDLRKEATTGVLGKQYATYSTGQRMATGLEQFAKNPSGYKDYATLMGGLKTLQGDESVVREAEVRLGINATSAINKALNYLNAAANGQQLQPSQRKEMIDTINILNEASRNQYLQSVAPILEQADGEGIPHSMILSGSLKGAGESKTPAAPSQYSSKEEAGIENYAKAKGISRDEAISKLKAGGRLK